MQVLLVELSVAVIVTGVLESTPDVVADQVPVVAPAPIVTEAGTVTHALFDAKLTVTPPGGAGTASVTVPPLGELPPTIDVGVIATLAKLPGFTVRVVLTVVVFVPESVTVCAEATEKVVTVKFTFEVFAGIVTVAGTEATAVFELLRLTTVPDGPDRPFR